MPCDGLRLGTPSRVAHDGHALDDAALDVHFALLVRSLGLHRRVPELHEPFVHEIHGRVEHV